MTYDFLKSLYDDIMSLVSGIVIKRNDMAIANETVDTIKDYEEFLACVKGEKNIYNFKSMDREVLSRCLPPQIVGMCMRDRRQIPDEYLDDVIRGMSEYVIENYVERNEYYRMLIGLPALDDRQYYYITEFSNIPNDVPVHYLSVEQIAFIESKGTLQRLQKENPDKPYLHYLGVHSIDLIEAHQAKPFQLLRLGGCQNVFVEEYFRSEYHKARRYVMTEIYNKHMFIDRPLYEPMMAFLIVCLAIRNALVPTEDMYLNFEEILDACLDSYGVLQYFERLPFTYKKRLVLMMDKLYQNKGTDGVMVDICKLFCDDNMSAHRYYLVKTHAKDINGDLIMDEDPHVRYDLNFLAVDVEDRDLIIKDDKILDYETIVDNDYLWQLDAEGLEKLKSEEFNIWMSKYVSAQAAYDLAMLTYEVCFFINLLLSARHNTGRIQVNNMYATTGQSDCFTMLIFMLSLMARRAGYDGNVIYEPQDMAKLWRFNLEANPEEIRNIITEYDLPVEIERIFFDERGKFLLEVPQGQRNENDMVNVYVMNREIFDSLQEAALNTRNHDHYIALQKIKQILFQSALTQINFTKSDGTIANTYIEMLGDLDIKLYNKVMNATDEELNSTTLYVMEKMEYIYSHDVLKYLFVNTPNTSISLLSKYIRTAIEVFKASSVQLDTINIFFYLGTDSPVRVFDEMHWWRTHGLTDQVNVKDEIVYHKTIILEDYVRVQDKTYTSVQ